MRDPDQEVNAHEVEARLDEHRREHDARHIKAIRDVARLEQEVTQLRTLCRRAAVHLTDHNGDYHHRTPDEFISELLRAAAGVMASQPAEAEHSPILDLMGKCQCQRCAPGVAIRQSNQPKER